MTLRTRYQLHEAYAGDDAMRRQLFDMIALGCTVEGMSRFLRLDGFDGYVPQVLKLYAIGYSMHEGFWMRDPYWVDPDKPFSPGRFLA